MFSPADTVKIVSNPMSVPVAFAGTQGTIEYNTGNYDGPVPMQPWYAVSAPSGMLQLAEQDLVLVKAAVLQPLTSAQEAASINDVEGLKAGVSEAIGAVKATSIIGGVSLDVIVLIALVIILLGKK